ncbi:hypothetical protein AgCh_037608 [Apium graveolens]
MTFEITNLDSGKNTHCGVLEFSAEEGCVYMPDWMMHTLVLKDGQFVRVEKTGNLAKATYMKIQPHSTDFVRNLSDPQVMLEEILKDFVCVTVGDTIIVNHEDQRYYIDIVAADPENVVSLFDTDCELDVMQPLDYEESPEQVKTEKEATELKELEANFAKFKALEYEEPPEQVKTEEEATEIKELEANFAKFKALDYEEPPEQVKAEEEATELKELEADFAKFRSLDYEEPPEQVKTEEEATELKELEADFAKFKPYTGVSRKLDENMSTNTTSVVAKTGSSNSKKMTQSDAVSPVCSRNYDKTDAFDQGDMNAVGCKNEVKKFQPFTGRKYTLSGS